MRLGLLSAAWLAGVLLGLPSGVDLLVAWLLAGSAGLLAIGLLVARLPSFPALLAVVLLLAVVRAELHETDEASLSAIGREVIATGSIADDPETTARQVRFEMRVSQIQVDDKTREVGESWLVYAAPPDDLVSRRKAPYFRYGDLVTVRGTPLQPDPFEGFDYAAHLAAQGISATMFAREARVIGEGGSWWRAAIYSVRGRLADSIERSMPYPESSVTTAMLLGKRAALPDELVEEFRNTGAAHLLAISGLHVGVLLGVVVGAAAWLVGRHHRTYLALAAALIWLYVLLAGASPSALRAAAMGTVYLAGLWVGRPSSMLPALALAAAVMTAVSPGLVRQVSFQLSFAAVGGISLALAMLGGRLSWSSSPAAGLLKRLLGWSAALVVVSTAATLATWPLVASIFGQVALVGVPVSLLTVPAVAPLIGSGILAAAGGLVLQPLGELLGWIAAAPAAYIIAVISAFPGWAIEGDWVGAPLLVVWYGSLVLALLAAQPRWVRISGRLMASAAVRTKVWLMGKTPETSSDQTRAAFRLPLPNLYVALAMAVALAIAAGILWFRVMDGPDGNLRVYFLDVGQGDSTLIVTPSGRQMLIDGGPDGDATSAALAEAMSRGDRSLDLMVRTHLDSDHSHGLLAVLDRYSVGAVVVGPSPPESEVQPQWEQRLRQHNIVAVEVREGYSIQLDKEVELMVLNPPPDRLMGESNNDSVAMRLTYGNVSVLLAADMEEEAEERLATGGADLFSTVLKVGHHGSSTSTTQRFLDAVGPAVAVISAGPDNPYGHPATSVLERLERSLGAENVYRTDLHGTVEVVSDGKSVWVSRER